MEYASKGVAGAGLGLGIAGTALGLLGGNLLGGNLLGGWRNSDDEYVTRYDSQKDHEIAAKDSEIALLKANAFTDQKFVDVYTTLNAQIQALKESVTANTCAQAVTNQKLSDNISFVDSKFDGVYKDIKCASDKLMCYVNATFVPGKLVMPLDAICPPAQAATTTTTTPAA